MLVKKSSLWPLAFYHLNRLSPGKCMICQLCRSQTGNLFQLMYSCIHQLRYSRCYLHPSRALYLYLSCSSLWVLFSCFKLTLTCVLIFLVKKFHIETHLANIAFKKVAAPVELIHQVYVRTSVLWHTIKNKTVVDWKTAVTLGFF